MIVNSEAIAYHCGLSTLGSEPDSLPVCGELAIPKANETTLGR